eukprot:CAMPEP_0198314120 /NCGR_PEP_ID=MMETSP1450-20131203/4899_1 /TAXON_ID=753684 ORGANISM="Madagascaria erythrocladiodes, Strain CCMP3234" /NCGR_SAMPLE_ID=MMETSP1450 /ASSEMBLY_ACC=CAM_ASM_001115 /LENGTH=416 /DNA_ID=CAMNT_0044017157 /DNA_START=103 /DNA_END=1353 /DNA_ORIENTATION=+
MLAAILVAAATVVAAATCISPKADCDAYPDACRNVTQLIISNGYPVEAVTATTEDGFVLSMQRIPPRRRAAGAGAAPAVLLQHGFLDASHTWVINDRGHSLAFLLSDRGYDVFLGNNRGNCYSMRSTRYSNDTDAFWAYSFDEMAQYDVIAQLDAAARVSGQSKVAYVGHSQGTLQMFLALAHPNSTVAARVAKRVSVFGALAPVAYLTHLSSYVVRELAHVPRAVLQFVLGRQAFPSQHQDDVLRRWAPGVCAAPIIDDLCSDALFLICGCNSPTSCDVHNWDYERVPIYAAHVGGASVQDLIHFAQLILSDALPYYDYGSEEENRRHYGSNHPPLYQLSRAATAGVPIGMFSGSLDTFADTADVQRAVEELGSSVEMNHIIEGYTHLDFIWAKNVATKLYTTVLIPFLDNYSKQ